MLASYAEVGVLGKLYGSARRQLLRVLDIVCCYPLWTGVERCKKGFGEAEFCHGGEGELEVAEVTRGGVV